MRYLAPEYVYTAQKLQRNRLIALNDDGTIHAITERDEHSANNDIEQLPGIALLPGFVNTHSHVFQRLLRGHTHRAISHRDTFWSWRHAMYTAARQLTPEGLYTIALQTYREMLAAGYTTVGEFHYVHHQPDGTPYASPNTMAEAIIEAGREAGIRVVMLMTAYAKGGFGQAPEEGQRRFCDASVETYLERVEALRLSGTPVGVAPHSVRAVPEQWFRAIASYSRQHSLPLHVHADEQLAEVEQCLQTYHCRPIELLERFEALSPLTTVIHATHADAHEIALLQQTGATVCVCPTTEGDLGDGIAPYAELLKAAIPLAIGSDSNTRLDPLEELRWAEYTARMRYQRRRVLIADEQAAPGTLLLTYGTRNGARALGIKSGDILPGMQADFIAIDLTHPTLQYWTEQDLFDVLCFGAGSEVITQVWVAGRCVKPTGA
jgi:formimidoylglutamate deiminase